MVEQISLLAISQPVRQLLLPSSLDRKASLITVCNQICGGSQNWRCSNMSILSLAQSGGGTVANCPVQEKKNHISVCVAAPAENRQYKPVTTFPLYSLSLAGSLLRGTQVLYKSD